jgi:hypothetical protein
MKKTVKNIILYSLIFFPSAVLAQVKSSSDSSSSDGPDVTFLFSSISSFLYVILGGIGVLSLVGFFIAAINYLTAGGDEERVGTAGRIFAFSLIGIIIATIGIIAINWAGSTVKK